MNPLTTDQDRDRLIDRLVDGELSEADRKDLLARLDSEADGSGWRRCALAFLEAQAWGEALRPVAAEASCPVPTPALATPPETRPLTRLRGAARLAIAASLLAAFATGWLARGRDADTPVGPMVASAPAPVQTSKSQEPAATPVALNPPVDALNPSDDTDAQSVWSDEDVERWHRQGYEVERRQRLVSLADGEGQDQTVPVDEVRLRYVGDRTY